MAAVSIPSVLLGILATESLHGYELKKRYDERFPKAQPLAYGQVYRTLQRLVRDGLVEILDTVADGAAERTRYRIIEAGNEALQAWLAEPVPVAPAVSNEIFVKLVVALLAGDEEVPARLLADQIGAHMSRIRELTAEKKVPGVSLATTLSIDYALIHLDADLQWMRMAAEQVNPLAGEVLGTRRR
ncbi:PadR family transcriptional regulator [Streptomyces chartreusis]